MGHLDFFSTASGEYRFGSLPRLCLSDNIYPIDESKSVIGEDVIGLLTMGIYLPQQYS